MLKCRNAWVTDLLLVDKQGNLINVIIPIIEFQLIITPDNVEPWLRTRVSTRNLVLSGDFCLLFSPLHCTQSADFRAERPQQRETYLRFYFTRVDEDSAHYPQEQ